MFASGVMPSSRPLYQEHLQLQAVRKMMFKKLAIAALISATLLASGCATHLSPGQKREFDSYAEKGFVQEEKALPWQRHWASSLSLGTHTPVIHSWQPQVF